MEYNVAKEVFDAAQSRGLKAEDTKNLVEFIRSLPSAKNIRVYSHEQCQSMNMSNETAAVRRSVIRMKNSK